MRRSDTVEAAVALAAQGAAIVRVRARSKRPLLNNWTQLPRMTPDEVRREMLPGENFGIRFGEPSQLARRRWLYGVDMDVIDRDPATCERTEREAWDALLARFPTARSWPRAISGSGGPSCHLLFQSDGLFRKCTIAKSARKIVTKDGIERPAFEIQLFGTGSQMIAAPSVHPITERLYEWWDGRPPVLAELPFIRAPKVESLFELREIKKRDRGDREPESLRSLQDMLDTNALANRDLDYDDWLKVVFAVHHEYDGTDLYDGALEILEDWSQTSNKHNQRDFERIWSHARSDHPNAVTLGTLKHKAAPELEENLRRAIAEDFHDVRPLSLPGEEDDSDSDPDDDDDPDAWTREPDLLRRDLVSGLWVNCGQNRIAFLEKAPCMRYLVWSTDDDAPYWRKPEGVAPRYMRGLAFGAKTSIPYDSGCHYQFIENALWRAPLRLQNVTKEAINDSVFAAIPNRPWSRVKELITRTVWDGVSRVEYLLQDYLGVKDSVYSREVSRLLVVGPMCRVLQPGTKIDLAPILQGPQGIGKDRFFEILCTFDGVCLYTASVLDMSKPAEFIHLIKGKLIVHFSEMTSFNRHSIETIKQFITHNEDSARLAYGRTLSTIPRTAIFVGSTNEKSDILRDSTGNRRFLPVQCGDPDKDSRDRPRAYKKLFDELEHDQPQIWAEAYVLAQEALEGGDVRVHGLTLSAEALKTASEQQEDQRAETAEEQLAARGLMALNEPAPLDDLLLPNERGAKTGSKSAIRNQVSSREFWVDVLRHKDSDFIRHTVLCARALNQLEGWERLNKKQRHLGQVVRVWRRKGTDGQPKVIDDLSNVGNKGDRVIRFPDTRRRKDP